MPVVYGVSGSSVVDVSTATAYSTAHSQLPNADYVSGSGVANILPHMGLSSVTLPIYAVIDLETAELLYYQDGYGSGPQGALTYIQGANSD